MASRLPAAPLIGAVERLCAARSLSPRQVLGPAGLHASYLRAELEGSFTLSAVERFCAGPLQCDPGDLYGDRYDQAVMADRGVDPAAAPRTTHVQDRAADQLAADSGGTLTSRPQSDTDDVLGFNVRVPFPQHKVCRWSPYDGHVQSGAHMGASMLDGHSPYCIHCGRGQDWDKLAVTTEEHFGHTWTVWRATPEAIPPPTPPRADGSAEAEAVPPEQLDIRRARQLGDLITNNLGVLLDATGHGEQLRALLGPAARPLLGRDDQPGPDCEISG